MKLQITIEGKSYEVDVELIDEQEEPGEPAPLARPKLPPPNKFNYPAPLNPDPKVFLSSSAGQVTRLNVTPGQRVESGQVLLVLETLGMESNMMATAPGTVKTVLVNLGDAVKINQPLVDFE